MGRTIEDINVVDVEKRRIPSKHYVYVIHATWSDGSTNVIYRRYSRFFDFQSALMEMFPEEAGTLDPQKRIIPFLPGKKFFGRSHIREVAMKRMAPIAEYCKALVKLPRKISQSKEVLEFFELEPDDINPPKEKKKTTLKANKISSPKALEHYIAVSDYKKQEKGEVTLKVGMLVEVAEKTETGWWFVNVEDEQGWVPSTCLEREDGVKEDTTKRFGPGEEEQYLCTEEFVPQGEDEIGLERGAVVDVVEKNLEGWWIVRYNGREGYAPATYLMKSEAFSMKKPVIRPTVGGPEIIKTLHDISDLLKEPDPEPEQEEKCYTIHELSKILKEDKRGTDETEKVYECIENMKSRSLTRGGSTRPPPRPSMKPKRDQEAAVRSSRPPLVHADSFCKQYVTIAGFSDAVGDGISFRAGEVVKVLEKSDGGWWYIEIDGKEGWAPATYIQESTNQIGEKSRFEPRESHMLREESEDFFTSEDSESEEEEESARINSNTVGLASALKNKLEQTSSKPPVPPPAANKKDARSGSVDVAKFHTEDSKIHGSKTEPGLTDKPKPPAPPVKHLHMNKDTSEDTVQPGFPIHLKPVQKEVPKPKLNHTQKVPIKMNYPPPPPPPPTKDQDSKEPASTKVKKPVIPTPSKPTETKINDSSERIKSSVFEKRQSTEVLDDSKPHVMGLAGALKAKFESESARPTSSSDIHKPMGFTDTKKPMFADSGVKPNPVATKPWTTKSDPPKLTEKPKLFGPTSQGALKKPEAFKKPDLHVQDREKPSSHFTASKTQEKEVVTGGKVSDLASVLKAKLENRRSVGDISTHNPDNEKSSHLSVAPNAPPKPVSVPKPFTATKPPRPVNPPSPKMQQKHGQNIGLRKTALFSTEGRDSVAHLNEDSVAKLNSLLGGKDTKDLDPTKYSSRPLPPKPDADESAPNDKDTARNNLSNTASKSIPNLPVKPKVNIGHKTELPSGFRSSQDVEKGLGVAGLASALKAKLEIGKPANVGTDHNKSEVKPKPVWLKNKPITAIKPKPESNVVSHKISDSKVPVVNNNNEFENMYYAIADYPGENEGEISLTTGVQVKLLEKADPWWFVTYDSMEGWAPASYFEEMKPGTNSVIEQSEIVEDHIESNARKSKSSQNKKAVFRTCSDFMAENEGELSFSGGEEVTVLENPEGGWWYVQIGGNEGWVPESYLEEV